MAFTDAEELKKWKPREAIQLFVLTFDKMAGMLLGTNQEGESNPAAGFVINPFGTNVVVTKELAAQLMAPRKEQ